MNTHHYKQVRGGWGELGRWRQIDKSRREGALATSTQRIAGT